VTDANAAERLTTALDAIRSGDGTEFAVIDTWQTSTGDGHQVFVSVAPGSRLERGDVYETWVVILGRNGDVVSLERFSSQACRSR